MTDDIRPIDKIRQHTTDERQKLELSEFGLTLYFRPLVPQDHVDIEERGGEDMSEQERRVMLVIQKAELEDGSSAFRWGDRPYLLREVPSVTINKMVAKMYSAAISNLPEGVDSEQVAHGSELEAGKGESGRTPGSKPD